MVILFLVLTLAPQEKKLPVPDSTAQKKVEALIKDIYREEYGRKAPSDRLALARTMFKQGLEPNDDAASRYVLFRESKDLALQGGDWDLSLKAADAIAKLFEEDPVLMKSVILSTASRGSKPPAECVRLSQAWTALAEDAAASNHFDVADKAAQDALSLAKLAKDTALAVKAEAKAKSLAEIKARAESVARARTTLAKMPDDPAANTTVGRQECLTDGAWKDGLPKLARGADSVLKEVAARDLADPQDGAGRVAVGDGWWNVADKESGTAQSMARSRAAYWYGLALPGLTGLTKSRVERRVLDLRQDRFPGTWVDITDARLFGRPGKAGEPIVLTPPPNNGIMAGLAQFPEGVFDGLSARLRFQPDWTANGLIQFETNARAFSIARPIKSAAICTMDPGGKAWIPKTLVASPETNEYVVTVLIKAGEYVVYLNASEVGRLPTNRAKLEAITIQADFAQVTFDQIKLRRKD